VPVTLPLLSNETVPLKPVPPPPVAVTVDVVFFRAFLQSFVPVAVRLPDTFQLRMHDVEEPRTLTAVAPVPPPPEMITGA
jgi:hypothetical protein